MGIGGESRRHAPDVEKLEAIARLAGGIAHDFNNLLTAVSGNVELLLLRHPPGDPDRALLEQVAAAASRAAALTNRLLAFSRRRSPRARVLDLNAVIRGLAGVIEEVTRPCSVAIDLAPGELRVRVDPGLVEEAVLSLATHARDAMPGGGTVRLATELVAHSAAVARLRVTDTGPGLSDEAIARLFEPFETARPGAPRSRDLGLALVYGFMKQSGGDVSVTSALGQGTTLELTLPATADALEAAERPEPAAPGHGETILVVDDEDLVRQFVAGALRARGYVTIEAASGPLALEAAARHAGAIDLVLSDVIMPTLSGPVLVAELKKQRPEVAVLFMSGFTGAAGVLAVPGESRPALLAKPFSIEELARQVRRVLDSASDSGARRGAGTGATGP